MADIADMSIYSYGCSEYGNQKSIIAIGANAQDPERMADFIDWLYSSEGISANGVFSIAQTAGPEGLAWAFRLRLAVIAPKRKKYPARIL